MTEINKLEDRFYFKNFSVTTTLALPAGSIGSGEFSKSAAHRLVAERVEHQKTIVWSSASTATTNNDGTHPLITTNNAGTIEAFKVRVEQAATGDATCTFDLHKASDGSTSYATVLSADVSFSSSDSAGTVKPGTVSSATLAANDSLALVIDATSGTGVVPQGTTVTLVIHEDPE